MREGLQRAAWQRAMVAAIALYALLLQSFVAHATPAAAPDPFGTICAADHAEGTPAPGKSTRHDHQCCTTAQLGTLAPPPEASAVTTRPDHPARSAFWRPEASVARTGPPTHAQSARGPPVA
jgi:hypothetical protein